MDGTLGIFAREFNQETFYKADDQQEGKILVNEIDPNGYCLQVYEHNDGRTLCVRVSRGDCVKQCFFDAHCPVPGIMDRDDFDTAIQTAEVLAHHLTLELLDARGKRSCLVATP